MKRIHVIYSGRVQGVGFRYTAEEIASQCGLRGWVRNRRDGSVELVVEGSEAALREFLGGMQNGPLGRNIFDAEVSWQAATGEFEDFYIYPTE